MCAINGDLASHHGRIVRHVRLDVFCGKPEVHGDITSGATVDLEVCVKYGCSLSNCSSDIRPLTSLQQTTTMTDYGTCGIWRFG